MLTARNKSTVSAPTCRVLHMTPYLVDDVSRLLGVSRSRVIALDSRLNPLRTPNGTRVYDRAAVDYVAAQRLAARAA